MIKECVKFVAFRRCMELAAQGYSQVIYHFRHYGTYWDWDAYDIAADLAVINYELAKADFYYKLGTRVFGNRIAPTAAQVRRFMEALAQWKQRHNRPRQ